MYEYRTPWPRIAPSDAEIYALARWNAERDNRKCDLIRAIDDRDLTRARQLALALPRRPYR